MSPSPKIENQSEPTVERSPVTAALKSGRVYLEFVHDDAHSGHSLDECSYATYTSWRGEFDEALALVEVGSEPLTVATSLLREMTLAYHTFNGNCTTDMLHCQSSLCATARDWLATQGVV